MAIAFKCKMCGGTLEIIEGNTICECDYCGTTQTVPNLDNEKKINLFNRANRLRINNEFDKAAGVYESIVSEFTEEAEAYWGLCLCKYGIEYVDDPATGKKIPTCHRTSFESIFDDENFELATEYADVMAKRVYREEAKEIDRIQKSILEIAQKEEPYDVFICYKETADDGQRTLDSVMAQDIYEALTEKGFKVFFSRITLEDKLGKEYEPYIFAALSTAKVMLAIGTRHEYFNAVWVKNEWSRFLSIIKKDKGKVLIPCYRDIDAYDMPSEFKNLQGQDMGKIGAMQDLVRAVGKLLKPENAGTVVKEIVSSDGNVATVNSLTRRAYLFLQDRNWFNANKYFDQILDIEPENAEAYLGKLLLTLELSNKKDLGNSYSLYLYCMRDNNLWEKLLRFSDDELKTECLNYYEQSLNNWKEYNYLQAVQEMKIDSTANDERAIGYLNNISDYKDSDELKEKCIGRIIERNIRSEEININDKISEWNSCKRATEKAIDEINRRSPLGFYGKALKALIIGAIILFGTIIIAGLIGFDSVKAVVIAVVMITAFMWLILTFAASVKRNGFVGFIINWFTSTIGGFVSIIKGYSDYRNSNRFELDECTKRLSNANRQIMIWQERKNDLPKIKKALTAECRSRYKIDNAVKATANTRIESVKEQGSLPASSDNPIDVLIRNHSSGRDLVSRITSVGSNDSNQPFPKGTYSSSISLSRFSVVFFHLFLKNTVGYTGKATNNYVIFDELNNIVFDYHGSLDVAPDYDRFSAGWIIKGSDGSSINTGKYTLVGWFNDSSCVKYTFRITE